MLGRFFKSQGGNFAVMTALAAVPLIGAVGLAVDYVGAHQKTSELQQVADAAALAAARELSVVNSSKTDIQSLVEHYVLSNFEPGTGEKLTVTAGVNSVGKSITAKLSYTWQPFFIHYLDQKTLPLTIASTAGYAGERENICVLALEGTGNAAIGLGKSSITANGCAIYSNSKSTTGITVKNGGMLEGSQILTSGGYSGQLAGYRPQPLTDTPVVPDPLMDRKPPSYSGCDHTNFFIDDDVPVTLKPGVYCGGLATSGAATANLEPGIYVIKDGPLAISGNSTLNGEHVGFYFTGEDAVFDFGVSTQANLTAPKTGALSGILFYEDRNSTADRVFNLRSKDAERFEGTVYLPKGTLFVDKASRVGQKSKWTAIIAKNIAIGNGPALAINSDYSGSDVPVPEGIAASGDIRLLK